ncbi:MAG: DUF945 family protein [Sulfurimonas sp.]
MKKMITILGVMVLGWLGMTGYISNTFKGEFEQYIERVNRLYASQGIAYKAEVESSFFTSDVKLEIHFDEERLGKAVTDTYAEFIALPVKVEYNVEHGPIFYRNGFGIGFAKFNAEMKASEVLAGKLKENLLKTAPQDITLYLTEVLCFDRTLKIEMHSSAIAMEESGEKVEIAPLVGSGVIDTHTLLGSFDIRFPKVSVEGNGVTAMAKDTTMHVEMNDILEGKYLLGEGQLNVAKISIEQEGLSQPVEMDFTVDFKTEREEGEYMMLAIDMRFNQEGLAQLEPAAQELVKQMNLSIRLNGVSVEALQKLEEINQKQVEMTDTLYEMMNERDQAKAEAAQKRAAVAQEAFLSTVTEAVKALLVKDRTKVGVAMDFTTKESIKSSLSFSSGYVGEALQGNLEEMMAYLQTKPLEYLTLDIAMDINEKHFALIQSPQEQQQAKMGFDMAVMQGMMSLDNGIYSTKLEYRPKTLKINGQDKTQQILPMLEMSIAQGARH